MAADKTLPPTRSLNEAAKDWASISLALRVFDRPEISIKETRYRRTVVNRKWIFITHE